MTISMKCERLARLAEVGDDDQVDMTIRALRRAPERRVATEDGKPAVDLEAVLLREVERTAHAHESALEDLRRWRLSHDHAEGGVI